MTHPPPPPNTERMETGPPLSPIAAGDLTLLDEEDTTLTPSPTTTPVYQSTDLRMSEERQEAVTLSRRRKVEKELKRKKHPKPSSVPTHPKRARPVSTLTSSSTTNTIGASKAEVPPTRPLPTLPTIPTLMSQQVASPSNQDYYTTSNNTRVRALQYCHLQHSLHHHPHPHHHPPK